MNEHDEILDLVDATDTVIGTVTRGEFNHSLPPYGFVRAAEGFIKNDNGELWIPRRTAQKTHAPNGLDFSVSEHVQSGETYLEAVVRGFSEELQLTVEATDLTHVGKIPASDDMPWFADIYLYRSNTTPNFNPDDFTGGVWITPIALLELLSAGEAAKTGLAPAVRFMLAQSQ